MASALTIGAGREQSPDESSFSIRESMRAPAQGEMRLERRHRSLGLTNREAARPRRSRSDQPLAPAVNKASTNRHFRFA